MPGVYKGSAPSTAIYFGDAAVSKGYYGSLQFFPAVSLPPEGDAVPFSYTGAVQTYTVEAHGYLNLKAWGAGGGGGGYGNQIDPTWGGAGGFAAGEIEVFPGDEIEIYVGQGGRNNRVGGWPDGGYGSFGDARGDGGGGSTSIWINGELVAVAGGGGGSAGYQEGGGGGGGLEGGSAGGSGGTQYDGGGPSGNLRKGLSMLAVSWPSRTGGAGGDVLFSAGGTGDDGGGGGGGYWGGGGGGGDARGGGGGSGFLAPEVTNRVLGQGEKRNQGGSIRPQPPATSDPDYPGSNIATGGQENLPGSDGYAVLRLNGVAGGSESHRYWRLSSMLGQDGNYIVIAEAYLRAGGVDLVPDAYSSTTPIGSGDHAGNTYDGNYGTYFHSPSGGQLNAWIAYDYGEEINPNQLRIGAANNNVLSRTPYSVLLEYSDYGLSGPWTTHSRVLFSAGWANGETRTRNLDAPEDTSGGHKFWKFGELTSSSDGYVVWGEHYLRETVGGANVIPINHWPFGWGGDNVGNLYDDNPSSYHHSPGGVSGTYAIAFEYARKVLPAQLVVVGVNGNIPNRGPYMGNVYWSDDGLTGPWTLWDDYNVGAGFTNGQVKTYDF